MLRVKEVFRTLQGEGSRAGSPAVFVRFTGCNLWSGHEDTRVDGAGECARWCDTDFAGGDPYTPEALATLVQATAHGMLLPLVVLTGGEPLLQLNRDEGYDFLRRLAAFPCEVALETNGTIAVSIRVNQLITHITVSPKPLVGLPGMGHLKQWSGQDCKVISPSPFTDRDLVEFGAYFDNRYLQPMDVPGQNHLAETTLRAESLGWRVSVQTHKLLGLR